MALRWGVAGVLLAAGVPALAAGLPALLLTLTLQEKELTHLQWTSELHHGAATEGSQPHCLAQGEKQI